MIFSIQELTTENHIENLIASITVTKDDRVFFKFNDVAIQNGHLSLKVRFLEDGNYQVISQIRSTDNIAVALLIPAGLVAIGLFISVIALILISRRRKEKTTE